MIRAVLLGSGHVGTYLAAGLERIKEGVIDMHGIPLARYRLPIKVDDIVIVSAYDVDQNKISKSLYDVALDVFGRNCDLPTALKEIQVRKGICVNSVKYRSIKALCLEEGRSVKEAVEELVSEWMRLKPDVIINVITAEGGKVYESFEEAYPTILNKESPASHIYAYATAQYAKESGEKVTFINATPAPVASNPGLIEIFKESGAIAFGDDAATGLTPLISDLLEHIAQRNMFVKYIAQFINDGVNHSSTPTKPEENWVKGFVRSNLITDILGYDVPYHTRHVGYLQPLGDKRYAAMRMEWIGFNGFRGSLSISTLMNESATLAGMLLDLIRLSKIAMDRGLSGTVYEVNAFFMRRPGPGGVKNVAKILAFIQLLNWLGLRQD